MSARAIVVVALIAAGSVLMLPVAAPAQNRSGGWVGLGGGYGSAGLNCDDCDEEREGSGVGFIRGGWTLNPHTLLGVDFHLWSKGIELEDGPSATLNLYNVAATLTFYPSPTSGLFVRGGAGLGFADMDIKGLGSKVTAELGKGLGIMAGAGYDIPLGRRVSLTPALDYWHGKPGDLLVFGSPIAINFKYTVIAATVGITIQ